MALRCTIDYSRKVALTLMKEDGNFLYEKHLELFLDWWSSGNRIPTYHIPLFRPNPSKSFSMEAQGDAVFIIQQSFLQKKSGSWLHKNYFSTFQGCSQGRSPNPEHPKA